MLPAVPYAIAVHWLGEPGCHDRALVGGKAAALSRLAGGHRVPPGFALVAETGSALDRAAAPPEELAGAYRSLGERLRSPDPPVAVRSSAQEEDGEATSFAGQHDTFLNVTGTGAVWDAVLRCWASARSERALEYRRTHGLDEPGATLPVLVQALVPADASAVVFSANPVTGKADEVVVNSSWGLGESLVGGTVTPDSFVVDRGELAVARRQVADKQRMTVAVPTGTDEVAVPWSLRRRASVTDGDAVEMARLAISLEGEMGHPVDVECAWHGGELYLLQCRAITSLPASRTEAIA